MTVLHRTGLRDLSGGFGRPCGPQAATLGFRGLFALVAGVVLCGAAYSALLRGRCLPRQGFSRSCSSRSQACLRCRPAHWEPLYPERAGRYQSCLHQRSSC
jgi:hypothetical protein